MESSLQKWIGREFENLHLKDERLNKRFKKIARYLAERSEKNISSSFEILQKVVDEPLGSPL